MIATRWSHLTRAALIGWVCLVGALGSATPASAKKVMFGTDDHLTDLQDVKITGTNGEALALAHKYSIHAFIAPYRLEDGGYVLRIKGKNSYYKISQEQIDRFQAQGLLPKPLPPYAFTPFDYIFGHLAWIIIGGLAIAVAVGMRRKARQAPALPLTQSALAHHQAGNLDAAMADYDKALAINPKLEAALDLRAAAHAQKGDLTKAVADYSKLININGRNAQALFQRAGIFHEMKNFAAAIADLTRVIKIDAKAPVPLYRRGLAHAETGNDIAAIKDFSSVIKLAPDAMEAFAARGAAYQRTGKMADAAADLARAGDLQQARAAAPPAEA